MDSAKIDRDISLGVACDSYVPTTIDTLYPQIVLDVDESLGSD